MKIRIPFVLLAVAFCIAGVARLASQGQDFTVEKDVQYGEAGGQKLKLDVYRPTAASEKPRPALVLVHGGGWVGGSKSDMRDVGVGAAQHGVVAFSVSYRLAREDGNHWPAQLDDVQRAVRWVRANAAKYNIDPGRIGAIGASAGGHLVTFLGTTDTRDNSDEALAKFSSRVKCVVNMVGPVDLADDFKSKVAAGEVSQNLVNTLLGKKAPEAPELARDASPIHRIDSKSAPFLIVAGKLDPLVPWEHGQRLHDTLQKAGVKSELLLFDDEGHALTKPQNTERVLSALRDFLVQHLEP